MTLSHDTGKQAHEVIFSRNVKVAANPQVLVSNKIQYMKPQFKSLLEFFSVSG